MAGCKITHCGFRAFRTWLKRQGEVNSGGCIARIKSVDAMSLDFLYSALFTYNKPKWQVIILACKNMPALK
jgi:hypothetical protein